MKVAKEKVWADENGNLVADGDAKAAVLVAGKGQNIPDAMLEQYKGADKFFDDAVFDKDGAQVRKEEKAKPVTPFSYNMVVDHGKAEAPAPAVQNRESEAKPDVVRADEAPAKSAAKKTSAKKS